MSEHAIVVERKPPRNIELEGTGGRLQIESDLGIAKLQILSENPDAWLAEVLSVAAPAPLHSVARGAVVIAWLAPGEWLLTGPGDEVERIRLDCAESARSVGLMVDVTHGRVSFVLSGRASRAILATHCPLDLSEAAMPVGGAMRSLFSDAGFFLNRLPDRDQQPCFRLIFDQTMAGYAERLLSMTVGAQG